MTDDSDGPSPGAQPPLPKEDEIKPRESMGPAFYAALALVGVLVILIVGVNVPGIRASAEITITQSDWILQSYAGDTGDLIPVLSQTKVTAKFGADGSLKGSSGCNQYTARYTLEDYAITISPLATTMMYCGYEGIMEQESGYTKNLGNVTELRISQSDLNLYDKQGKTLLVFVAVK